MLACLDQRLLVLVLGLKLLLTGHITNISYNNELAFLFVEVAWLYADFN